MFSSLFEAWFGRGRRTDRILEGLREPMWKMGDADGIRRATLDEAIKRVEADRKEWDESPDKDIVDIVIDTILDTLRSMSDESATP